MFVFRGRRRATPDPSLSARPGSSANSIAPPHPQMSGDIRLWQPRGRFGIALRCPLVEVLEGSAPGMGQVLLEARLNQHICEVCRRDTNSRKLAV